VTCASSAPRLHTLANGLRLLVLHRPAAALSDVSLFVRCGSAHEPRTLAGMCHLLEHMVFKGSATRDGRQINLDAERLGAEVNAHTDRDHMAFHMRGLGAHAPQFVRMLADIVLSPRFPPDELARERAVVLQEYAEDEDDPVSCAYRLFDACCFGNHPAGRPIIGTRRGIQAVQRDHLLRLVQQRFTGSNMVLAVAGPWSPEALLACAEPLMSHLPSGTPDAIAPAAYCGGLRSRGMAGSGQSHLVLGGAIGARCADDPSDALAAAVFGEGMSSPLLDELRERRGLVYHAACSADLQEMCGQWVVEASTAPEHLQTTVELVSRLLADHAARVAALDLARARQQLAVKWLRLAERPHRLLETMVLDLWSLGRVRTPAQAIERLEGVPAEAVRAAFERLLAPGLSVAVSGHVARGLRQSLPQWLAVPLAAGAGADVPSAPPAGGAVQKTRARPGDKASTA
jgi:predicted Zn-dependent peptidase